MGQRSPAVRGPEPWTELGGVTWCHWDRWFALVCVRDFGGDWEALVEWLWSRLDRNGYAGDPDVEAKTSHVADLRARLARAGLPASALAGAGRVDGRLLARARRKVLEQPLARKDLTEAMRGTPRARLRARALRGRWEAFPASPGPACERFEAVLRRHARARAPAPVKLAGSLLGALAEEDARCSGLAEQLATRRAFLTVACEAMADLGEGAALLAAAWLEGLALYVQVSWERAGLSPEAFYRDLCELLVVEESGMRSGEVAFAATQPAHVDLCARVLAEVGAEWRAARLGWWADRAKFLTAELYLVTRSRHRYEEAARALGSEEWQPVVALAEEALAAGDRALARRVFLAADRPGFHRATLRRCCQELVGPEPFDDRCPPATW